jgi:hypothetical protein
LSSFIDPISCACVGACACITLQQSKIQEWNDFVMRKQNIGSRHVTSWSR